jgi:hypothetical protein
MELKQESIDAAAAACLKVSLAIAVITTAFFWGSWFIILFVWMCFIPLALLLGIVVGTIWRARGATLPSNEKPSVWFTDEEYEKSPEIIGMLDGTPIHEWIIIKDEITNNDIKLFWEARIDVVKDGFTPPPDRWFIIVPPGLLYLQPEILQTSDL